MFRRCSMIVVIMGLVQACASASIGESIAQTEKRYGPSFNKFPRADRSEDRAYTYKTFIVLVSFVRGKSEIEIYTRDDGQSPLSEQQLEFILDLNSRGMQWRRAQGSLPTWYLGGSGAKSHTVQATYYPKIPQLNAPGMIVKDASAK